MEKIIFFRGGREINSERREGLKPQKHLKGERAKGHEPTYRTLWR